METITGLTRRERVILAHLALPLTLSEIAAALFVTRNTVKSQTIAIYRKLGTSSRAGAVEIAVAAGLLDASARPGWAAQPDDQLSSVHRR